MASSSSLQNFERSISLNDLDTALEVRELIEKDLVISQNATTTSPRFLRATPRYNFVLPKLAGFVPDYRKFIASYLVDTQIYKDLESTKRLNWCSSVHSMVPVLTIGDGNCLMHAASLGMWAINDRYHTLRKTVYEALLEDSQGIYHKRWRREHEVVKSKLLLGGFEMSEDQWGREWDLVMKLVSQMEFPNGPQGTQYGSLEEIHIFVMANVLRRTIIVICEDTLRGNYGEPFAPVNFGGVYLPLHWDPVDCIKSPLVIGYCQGHFTAIVSLEDGKLDLGASTPETGTTSSIHAIPLVKHDESPLPIHFLFPDEEKQAGGLLRQYLDCVKLSHRPEGREDIETNILAAQLQFVEPPECIKNLTGGYFAQARATYEHMLDQKSLEASNPSMPQYLSTGPPALIPLTPCRTEGCEFFGSVETANYCSSCLNKVLKSSQMEPGCAAQNMQPVQRELPQQLHPSQQQPHQPHILSQQQMQLSQQQMQLSQERPQQMPANQQQQQQQMPTVPSSSGARPKQMQLPDHTSQQTKNCTTENCKYLAAMGTGDLCVRCFEAQRIAKEISPSIVNASVPCANKVNGCQFFGHPDRHNLCSRCFSKFLIQMERNYKVGQPLPPSVPAASPPVSPPVSNLCQSPGCPNTGVPALYNRCVYCYASCIKAFINSDGKSVAVRPSPAPLPGSTARKGNLCATPGCLEERVPQLNNLCVECYETKIVRPGTSVTQANSTLLTTAPQSSTPSYALATTTASAFKECTFGSPTGQSVTSPTYSTATTTAFPHGYSTMSQGIPQGTMPQGSSQGISSIPQWPPQAYSTMPQGSPSTEQAANQISSPNFTPTQQVLSTTSVVATSSQSPTLTSSLLNAIGSQIYCTTFRCMNPVGSGTGNLCPRCFGESTATAVTAPAPVSQAAPRTVATTPTQCKSPGCNQPASPEKNNFCLTHFLVIQGPPPPNASQQKQPIGPPAAVTVPGPAVSGASQGMSTSLQGYVNPSHLTSAVLPSSAHAQPLLSTQPAVTSVATPISAPAIRCPTPGCSFYGIAEKNFLCSRCYSCNMEEWRWLSSCAAQPQPAPMQPIQPITTQQVKERIIETCAIAGCRNKAVPQCNGLCDYCYQSAIRQELQQWPNKPKPPAPATGQGTESVSQSQDTTPDNTASARTKVTLVPCMGKGCLRLDVPAAQSYCESCRRKLEKEQGELHQQFEALNASERANQAQTPPTEKRTITHAPEQVTPSEVLNVQSPAEGKCIHYGCKMYGTPEYNGYCSKCFMEIVCTPYANSAPDQPRRNEDLDSPRVVLAQCVNAGCTNPPDPIMHNRCARCFQSLYPKLAQRQDYLQGMIMREQP